MNDTNVALIVKHSPAGIYCISKCTLVLIVAAAATQYYEINCPEFV